MFADWLEEEGIYGDEPESGVREVAEPTGLDDFVAGEYTHERYVRLRGYEEACWSKVLAQKAVVLEAEKKLVVARERLDRELQVLRLACEMSEGAMLARVHDDDEVHALLERLFG